MGRKLTQEQYIKRITEKHGNRYDYSKVIYINNRTKVLIGCAQHGYFEQNPHNHAIGQGCPICGIEQASKSCTNTQEQYLEKVNRVHNYAYNYTKTKYVNANEKVIITCKIHGDFTQTAYAHTYGHGCPSCGEKTAHDSHKYDTEIFINNATNMHGDLFDYSETNYVSSNEKVDIICKIHGKFKKWPADHLRGGGCPKCGWEGHWRRSEYVKKANGRVCTFYTLKCFNENEEFYKIGMTMDSTINRYRTTIKMPYSYEIISEVFGEAGFIWDLELAEKRKLQEFNYQPQIKFGGSKTECFTQYKTE